MGFDTRVIQMGLFEYMPEQWVASEKTYCKPFDMLITQQWVFDEPFVFKV